MESSESSGNSIANGYKIISAWTPINTEITISTKRSNLIFINTSDSKKNDNHFLKTDPVRWLKCEAFMNTF